MRDHERMENAHILLNRYFDGLVRDGTVEFHAPAVAGDGTVEVGYTQHRDEELPASFARTCSHVVRQVTGPADVNVTRREAAAPAPAPAIVAAPAV